LATELSMRAFEHDAPAASTQLAPNFVRGECSRDPVSIQCHSVGTSNPRTGLRSAGPLIADITRTPQPPLTGARFEAYDTRVRRAEHASSDADLVEAVRGGDTNAFSELYAQHAGAVRFAIRDNVHDDETVADIVQDTFVRALERLPSLRNPERFRPWLLSIARNAAIDSRRARQRSKIDDLAETDDLVGAEPQPAELAELSELAELVNGCVGGLSARDATAITLVTRLGFGSADVATALGISNGAAKVVVHRARRRLRDALSLELMVRATASPCVTLNELLNAADVAGAAAHVRACAQCIEAASAELTLYDAGFTP
jgi:RNA polymerase sigma factor (sigma-70 family)